MASEIAMRVSQNCIDLVKKFEGFRPKVYHCVAGYKTIGYGHRLNKLEIFDSICTAQAAELLHQDLDIAAIAVRRNITYDLNQNQCDALCSFVFNVGAAALQRSTLRQKINYAELDNVESEMLKWVYVNAVKVRGLVLRRKAEIELFYRC